MEGIARLLIFVGFLLVVIGGLLYVGSRLGFGTLPGDIVIRRGNFTFYFPLVTSLLLSIILTVLLNLLRR